MSADDRLFPDALPVRTAALTVLTALFFSHCCPMLIGMFCRRIGIQTQGNLVLALTALYLPALLALGIIALLFFRVRCRFGVMLLAGAKDLRYVFFGWVISIAGCGLLTGLWKAFLCRFPIDFQQQQQLLMIAGRSPGSVFWLLFIFAAVVVPIFEEVTFRRALYSLLSPAGRWQACIIGSVMFGLLHFFLLGFPGLAFFGIVLQYSFLKTKNLTVPILIHALFNAWSLWGVHVGQG